MNENKTAIEHYDFLVTDNISDPVRDPELLREYMNKWDGKPFLDALQLDSNKIALEIGIGTGRIAVSALKQCNTLYGIDLSARTIERAAENLLADNVVLICSDYLNYEFDVKFDVIYSTLTSMHIEKKQEFFDKVAGDLKVSGRFVISIDDNQDEYLDMGIYRVRVYPDNPVDTEKYILNTGLKIIEIIKTEHAHIFVCEKK